MTIAATHPEATVSTPTARERLATATLLSALLLGVAGDLLLRGGGLGLNALLLSALTVAVLTALDRRRDADAEPLPFVLLLPMLVAGVVLAWRASIPLKLGALAVFAASVLLLFDALRTGATWSLARLEVWPLARAGGALAGGAVAGAPRLVAHDVPADVTARTGVLRALSGSWRGVAVAVPVLLVLNVLLMTADPVYARVVGDVIDVDFAALLGHVAFASIIAWATAGVMRTALLTTPATVVASSRTAKASDVLLPLALVDALFLVFLLVQVRTLVGGAEYVRATAGLSFAEYARRGFFELLWVAGITLPLLLAADTVAPVDHHTRRRMRALMLGAVAMLAGILASAAGRMWLYLQEYGLTELRLYASAAMAWLAVVLAWFGATVLRGRRERFVGGALVAAFATWATLAVAGPDALIVRTNVARLERGERFDAAYVTALSADAVPALAAALPRLPAETRCRVRDWIHADAAGRARPGNDWRSWTIAGARADGIAAEEGACTPTPAGTPAAR